MLDIYRVQSCVILLYQRYVVQYNSFHQSLLLLLPNRLHSVLFPGSPVSAGAFVYLVLPFVGTWCGLCVRVSVVLLVE